jgi:hypothetical protein
MSFLNNNKNSNNTTYDENEKKCQECMTHLTSILMTMTSKPKILFEAMGVSTSSATNNLDFKSAATNSSNGAENVANASQSDVISANGTNGSNTISNSIFWTMDDDGKGLRLKIPKAKPPSLLQSKIIHDEAISGFGGAATIKRNKQESVYVNNAKENHGGGDMSTAIANNNCDENDALSKTRNNAMNQQSQEQQNENNQSQPALLPIQNGKRGILQRMKTKLTNTFQSKQLVATSSINNNNTNIQNDNHITLEIQCRECGTSGPEGSARAYLRGPSPLTIILCTNRLSLSNNKEIDEVLTHELIHVFDVHHRKWDFTNCQTLARSEIRAAREAECDSISSILTAPFGRTMSSLFGKDRCVMEKAKEATKNMFPYKGFDCVNHVFKEAMVDNAPFGNDGKNGREKSEEEKGSRSTIATSWLHDYDEQSSNNNNNNDGKRSNDHGGDGFIAGRAFTSSYSS